jgi:hypothetical protein
MATIDERRAQLFPKLGRAEIERIRRLGKISRYRAGEALLTTGEPSPGMFPTTQWLKRSACALDRHGFVRTGTHILHDELHSAELPDQPPSLESNVSGLFAVGDVRSGSVKRVGAAIGEGAEVVPQLHTFLAKAAVASR